MAKKDAYEAFLADVLKAIPADRRSDIEATLKDESISNVLAERVMARSEFSRQMDSLSQEREEFQRQVQEARTNIDGWANWYQSAVQEQATLQEKVAQYEALYGGLDDASGSEKREAAQAMGLTKEQLDAELRHRDEMAIRFADVLTDLKLDYKDRFGGRLDTKALTDYAMQHSMPIDAAYREMIAPELEKKREAELEEKIKRAREEGEREALSRHNLPMTTTPNGPRHVLDLREQVKTDSKGRVAAAVADWNNAGRTGQ